MKYQIKESLNFCFRLVRTRRLLCGVLAALFTVGILGVLSATSMNTVELVSVNIDGTDSGNNESGSFDHIVISADGRFVAFSSYADNLVATDANHKQDLFVRDLQSGTTTLVSVSKDGIASGTDLPLSFNQSISADGRFVAFHSEADDLVATDTNHTMDVFVRDLKSGTTTLASVNKDGTNSGGGSFGYSGCPVISADGRFVAFTSNADDLVATDTNDWGDVFVRDLQSGTTTLVSINKDGTDSGNSASYRCPWISANGRFVAFLSHASDLVATDTNSTWDVFVRDLQGGTTTLVSVNRDGTGSGNTFSDFTNGFPVISADGRFVVFTSSADNLVATDTNGHKNVFVRDLQSRTTTLVTVNKDGIASGNDIFDQFSPILLISADGRFVVFGSGADDLVATDTNGMKDVFVRDLQRGTTTLVSVNKDGTDSGNNQSYGYTTISADGRFVAFTSSADNLVATDTNDTGNVFVRDLQSGTTTLVSVNKDGTSSGNDYSVNSVISANGQFVAFTSSADNLVATDTNGMKDVFIFDVFKAPLGCNCDDPSAIKGTSGHDFLYGTEQADIICGLDDEDFIAGQGGDDCIDGGDGNDWIYGGEGDDTIFGRAGKDVIYGHHGNDEIYGDEDEDFLFGGTGDDSLDGGEGDDWIFCGGGTDKGIGEYVGGCEN